MCPGSSPGPARRRCRADPGCRARRLDRGQRQCRPRARRQRGPVEGRRNIGPWQPGIRLQYHQCCRLFGSAERISRTTSRRRGAFDAAAGIVASASLATFSASSVSWLEAARKDATSAAEYSATLVAHASDVLSNATGVNLDEEMSLLLDLEKSYQASSKLLAVIDNMLAALSPGSDSDEDDLRLDARRGERNAPLGDGDAVRAGEAAEGDHKRPGGGHRACSRRAYRPHGRVRARRAPAWRR